MINIGIVDDEALFRKGLNMLIQKMKGIQVILEAGNGSELLNKLNITETVTPDIIILDLNMPILDGVETYKKLKEEFPNIHVIILTSHFKKAFVLYMLELGVASFIPKDTDISTFKTVIQEVSKKGFYYSEEVLEIINLRFKKKIDKPSKSYLEIELTDREYEILKLICHQYTTKEIGAKLFISPRTVEGHRVRLLEKLDCKNIAGLVAYAIQHGMIDLSTAPKFKR